MDMVNVLHWIVLLYATFWASYVLCLPLIARLHRAPDRATAPRSGDPSIALIVPARNMGNAIGRCVRSLRASSTTPMQRVEIFVVADHCVDDTAEQATAAEAQVLVRNDGPPGKTYTLDWTLKALSEMGVDPDLYVVVDATAEIDKGFLEAMSDLWRRGEDIIVGHPVVDPANQKWFARSLGLMLAHRNLQNRSRERLRLSALIEGRGMAYSRDYVRLHGWSLAVPKSALSGSHPTEDWRHAVRAVEHGHRVAFADGAKVITALRDSLVAATKQGVRWERGRMANAVTHALRLLLAGLRSRSALRIMAALDAIQPPVAILGAVSLVLAVWTFAAAETNIALVLGVVPLLLLVLYVSAVVTEAARDGISPRTVLWAPLYVAWRCVSFALAWAFLDRFQSRGGKRNAKESSMSSN